MRQVRGLKNADHPLLLLAARLLLQPNTGRCCPSMQRNQKLELKKMLRHAVNTVIVNSVTRMMSNESQLQVLGHYPRNYCYLRCWWLVEEMTAAKGKTWRSSHHYRKPSRNHQPNFELC
jgi:hypothetical protein